MLIFPSQNRFLMRRSAWALDGIMVTTEQEQVHQESNFEWFQSVDLQIKGLK